ncbi:MAG: hypothetical protein JST86_01985 [Bacteroidetes bacterium]|nr:hypothetical protein [Bacteroidota bacterium]
MGIENETREFFVRIIQSISMVLLWMMLNVFFGLYKELAYFSPHPQWMSYLYYILSIAGLVYVFLYVKRKWKL